MKQIKSSSLPAARSTGCTSSDILGEMKDGRIQSAGTDVTSTSSFFFKNDNSHVYDSGLKVSRNTDICIAFRLPGATSIGRHSYKHGDIYINKPFIM